MNKEKIIYIVVLIIVGLIYVLLGSSGAGSLLVLFAVYGIFGFVVSRITGRNLEVSLTAKGEIQKGMAEGAKVSVKNNSRLPVLRAKADWVLRNDLTQRRRMVEEEISVWPGKTLVNEYQVGDGLCGKLEVELSGMTVLDPLGIFRKKIDPSNSKLREMIDASLYVLPEIGLEDISPEELERYDMESYRFAESKVGNDTSETVGIRSYEPGDSIRTIHWKLSAKTGETVVRELGLPVDNRLMIVFDKSYVNEISAEEIDELTDYLASVSFTLIEKELNHSVGWFDSVSEEFIYRTITSEEDVFDMVAAFISGPFYQEPSSGVDRYLEADAEKNFASFIVIGPRWVPGEDGSSDSDKDAISKLREYGYVSIFTPGKTE